MFHYNWKFSSRQLALPGRGSREGADIKKTAMQKRDVNDYLQHPLVNNPLTTNIQYNRNSSNYSDF